MQPHSNRKDVLSALACQEVTASIRVELRIYRYTAALEEISQFEAEREEEIEHDFERVFAEVLEEARRRQWAKPFIVALLAGPAGPLQRGPYPWEHAQA